MLKFTPLGVIVQRMDIFMEKRPKNFYYDGLCAYTDTPLDGFDDLPEAKYLQMEFYDWIICQKEDGKYSTYPEAFYSQSFLRRYLYLCNKLCLPTRCLFAEYDGDERFWRFDIPNARFMGYEVCDVPRNTDMVFALDSDIYAKHRNKLNSFGLFNTPHAAMSFKEEYEANYKLEASYHASQIMPYPELHIFRISDIPDISSLI